MQTFFFDMKDGVPHRDRIGIVFGSNIEAIEHSKVLAKHFRDGSLSYDRELEISVVNESGREIHANTFIRLTTTGRQFPGANSDRSKEVGKAPNNLKWHEQAAESRHLARSAKTPRSSANSWLLPTNMKPGP